MLEAVHPTHLHAGVLAACQAHAENPKRGQQAFLTWTLIQTLGIEEARRRVSRSTFYKHLQVLRTAGVALPPVVPANPGGSWFGKATASEALATLTAHPGRLMDLVDQPFEVVQPWPTRGLGIDPGDNTGLQYDLDAWPVGTSGVVVYVLFDGQWQATLEHTFHQTLSLEFSCVTVPINTLIQCTVPKELPSCSA